MTNSHQAHDPEPPAADPGAQATAEPTVHEFLTKLATDPAARSAFDADPQTTLDQAGLGDMTATDVAHATSLLQDYAPVYEMAEHHRTLQNSVDQFTSQHIAISNLRSAHPHEQEVLSMLQNNPEQDHDFSAEGDTDEQLSPQQGGNDNGAVHEGDDVDVDMAQTDSQNLVDVHDVASGNSIADAAGGDVLGDAFAGLGETVNATVGTIGNIASTTVNDVTSTVDNTVNAGSDVFASAGDPVGQNMAMAEDSGADLAGQVTNAVDQGGDAVAKSADDAAQSSATAEQNAQADNGPATDVTSAVGDVTSTATQATGDAPVAGDAAQPVEDAAGDLPSTIDNPTDAAQPVEDAVGDLPSTIDNPTDAAQPVEDAVGTATQPVEDAAGDLPVDDLTDDAPVDDLAGDVTSTATDAAGDLPVAGDVAEEAPTADAAAADDGASALPEPSDVPVAGDVAGDTVDQASGDLDLNGLL